jgi:type IV pilus assembly protein PilN
MIRINLLPFRQTRKKENIRRQVSIFMGSLILVCLVLFAGNYFLGLQVDSLKDDIKKTEAELKKYNEINAEIARIKKTLENLQKKMNVINTLETNRHAPVRLLDAMAQVVPMPKRLWLTRLVEKNSTVKLDGIAMDEEEVAQLMRHLQSCGLFKTVSLKTLKHKLLQERKLKYFQILCDKAPVTPPAEKTAKKKAKT